MPTIEVHFQTLSHQDAGRVLDGEQLDCTITEGLTGIQLCNVWYLDYISHIQTS